MILNKFVIHILDKNSDVPILNDYEGNINSETDIFFNKSIKKVIKNDYLRLAKFNDYNDNLIKNCCEQIIYNEKTFLENSKEIASYLFEKMKLQSDIQACDLAVCLYTEKDEKYVAILILDYKKIYNHSLEFEDEKFNIQMKVNEIGITDTTSIRFAAIIGANRITNELL